MRWRRDFARRIHVDGGDPSSRSLFLDPHERADAGPAKVAAHPWHAGACEPAFSMPSCMDLGSIDCCEGGRISCNGAGPRLGGRNRIGCWLGQPSTAARGKRTVALRSPGLAKLLSRRRSQIVMNPVGPRRQLLLIF